MTRRTEVSATAAATAQELLARRLLARRAARGAERMGAHPAGADAPISCGQERMWLVEQMAEPGSVSNFIFVIWLRGRLDVSALERAITELHRRHEILRTVFVLRNGLPRQHIREAECVPLAPQDLRGCRDPRAEARQIAAEFGGRPYEFTREPLVRWRLLQVDDAEHGLVMCMHHAVADAWSEGIIRRELSALYSAFLAGQPSPLPELPVQYAGYAVWQRRRLNDGSLDADIQALKERFADAPGALVLPGASAARNRTDARGGMVSADLPGDLVAAVAALAAREGVSLYMALLAAFSVIVARCCGQRDFVVGSPVAGRPRPELEPLIGFFVNTVPFRVDVASGLRFRELLALVRDCTLDAYSHQDVPFERLVKETRPARVSGREPLVQVLFQLINTPDDPMAMPGLEVEWEQLYDQNSPMDLAVNLVQSPNGLTGYWEYRSAAITREAVCRMQEHLRRVLKAVTADPEALIEEIDLIGERERVNLRGWGTGAPLTSGHFVHEGFELCARRRPDAIAVVCDGMSTTYGELSMLSDRLARRLRTAGVRPGTLAGVFLPRGLDAMVATLGILKAGGGYVPMDPGYPTELLTHILQDAGPSVVVCTTALAARLPETTSTLLVGEPEGSAPENGRPLALDLRLEDTAYVIYAAGSVGHPEGTVITHRSLIKHLQGAGENFPQIGREGTLVHSSLGGDFTVTPLFLSLLGGKPTVIVTAEDTIGAIAEELSRPGRDYSWIKLTASQLDALRLRLPADARIDSVRLVVISGEQLRRESVAAWRRVAPATALMREYGPAEATAGATVHRIGPASQDELVPIGRPVSASSIYLLDPRGELVSPGVVGELFIGGEVLARGYLHRPTLTAEKFVPDPFSKAPGARLYRTGDLARWREDGQVELLGRIDRQVKIRGHRVDLDEIEAVLAVHPGVLEVVAEARDQSGGDKLIVAYWVPDRAAGEPANSVTLRRWLRGRMPDYLAPGVYQELGSLPRNAHGKVDRSRLLHPEDGHSVPAGDYVALGAGRAEGDRRPAATGAPKP